MNNNLQISWVAFFSFLSVSAHGQTLNDVVSLQLTTIAGNHCLPLLGVDDPNLVLTGQLRTICTRPAPVSGGALPSSSDGGGAATPSSLPKIVVDRLKNENDVTESDQVVNLNNGFSVFFSGEYQNLDREISEFEEGYNSDIWRLNVGGDFRIDTLLTVGAAFDLRHQTGEYASLGDFQADAYGVIAYLSLTPLDNWFMQFSGGYSRQDNERNRFTRFSSNDGGTVFSVNGFVSSDYAADEYNASFQTGYDFSFERYTFGPRAGIAWIRTEFDSYTEAGNTGLELRFAEDRRSSLQSRLGLFGSAAFSTSVGVIVPQVSIDWVHEFANDQREISFSFADDLRNSSFVFNNERPDRDFIEFTVSTSIVLPHGIQGYISYQGIASHNYHHAHSANVGVSMEF